jgi:hypothetical protein
MPTNPLCCAVLRRAVVCHAEAVPKKILELMKVDGLTRENVASHLQKYRLYLKRVQQNAPQHGAGSNGGSASAAAAAAAAGAAGNAAAAAGFAAAAGMGLPGIVGPNQMWGNSKQLMDAMQAQQQAAAATVQQAAAAAGQQQQQQPGQPGQPQMGVMGAADGGMGGLLGMLPGGGLMSPMGQMMPGMAMPMGAMPGGFCVHVFGVLLQVLPAFWLVCWMQSWQLWD